AASGADHEPEVAVELGHVAGHPAVVRCVDLLAGDLEGRGLARLAGLLLAHAELGEQLLVPAAGLVLDLHVRVERHEGPVRAAARPRGAGRAPGPWPADLERKDLARMILGLLGRIGELDPARLHAPAGEDLRLDHRWPADALGDLARLRGVGREAVVGDGDA